MTKTTPRKLFLFKECEHAIHKERFDLVERLQKLEQIRTTPGCSDEYLKFTLEYIQYKREHYGEDPVRRGEKIGE